MATALYDKGREAFLAGDIDWAADDIRAILVDAADYTVSLSTHNALDDIPGGARVAVSPALTGKTVTNGVADHATGTFPSVTGDQSEAVVYYKHTGTESTSLLIAYVDNYTGLPVTPNGEDITFTPSTGSNRLFKL
jgi:hypothetical protein